MITSPDPEFCLQTVRALSEHRLRQDPDAPRISQVLQRRERLLARLTIVAPPPPIARAPVAPPERLRCQDTWGNHLYGADHRTCVRCGHVRTDKEARNGRYYQNRAEPAADPDELSTPEIQAVPTVLDTAPKHGCQKGRTHWFHPRTEACIYCGRLKAELPGEAA